MMATALKLQCLASFNYKRAIIGVLKKSVCGLTRSISSTIVGVNCFRFQLLQNTIHQYHNKTFSYFLANLNWQWCRMLTTTMLLEGKKNPIQDGLQRKMFNEKRPKTEPVDWDRMTEDPVLQVCRDRAGVGLAGAHHAWGVGKKNVLVWQPWVKWGPMKRDNTSNRLLLEEAVALMETLPNVTVIDQEIIPVTTLTRHLIFGTGTLGRLADHIRSLKSVNAIFISMSFLKPGQVRDLEAIFCCRVLDRYAVVLSIFHHRAKTQEAKLQVSLAELPYLRKRSASDQERLSMENREKHLTATLTAMAARREHRRLNRARLSIPSVAVVGYTNCGKTTLIRALTGDKRAQGLDQLFATLDVTTHAGQLPCGLQILYVDTVGFIQDIPTDLVASFRATLRDLVCADVVIHVRDISHPDYKLQGLTVHETLTSMELPEGTPIVTVDNKVDRWIEKGDGLEEIESGQLLKISAIKGTGLNELAQVIQDQILRVTGRQAYDFVLPTGSEEIAYIRRQIGISYEEVEAQDSQSTRLTSLLTLQDLAMLRRKFPHIVSAMVQDWPQPPVEDWSDW